MSRRSRTSQDSSRRRGSTATFDRRPAVTYAADSDELEAVAGEFEAATAAGLPVQWNDDDAGLPYPVAGAVWLGEQIGFHPVKYVLGLAKAFVSAGGRVF